MMAAKGAHYGKREATLGRFRQLCTARAATVENLDTPYQDMIQDAWLAGLESMRRNGKEVPNARTSEELFERFEDDAGLFVNAYGTTVANHYRERYGAKNAPKKRAILRALLSLDNDDNRPWLELVEDGGADVPFTRIEELDDLQSRMVRLTPQERKVIRRFAHAWALQEAGYKLPRAVIKRVALDRQKTGLPLVFKRGRQSTR